ncbi:MAG: hypothetical protein IJW33_00300 [Lentisphaeria bacterium]|nr:hypothetical protein [Lentisphaeria bacterium]
MTIEWEKVIPDPVIAPSGKVMSAGGLRLLAAAICGNGVDNGALLWRRNKRHERREKVKNI